MNDNYEEILLRKIIHIDMDAFYASIEQKDNPSLKGKPIAVGGGQARGVVAAASYEARKYGVKSAMSGLFAKKICPDLIFVSPRFERYREISKKIRSVFYKYTDLVEPVSLDEAYLDVTKKSKKGSASQIAAEIRRKIKKITGLNASAGVSSNKFLAKIASDWNKPNGQKTISSDEIDEFIDKLDIKKFHGIGRKTSIKMYNMGIFLGSDLKKKNLDFLTKNFGKAGKYFYNVARGIHNTPVKPYHTPKSLGAEKTFSKNLTSEIYLEEKLEIIALKLENRLKKYNCGGRTVTVKLKFSNFSTQTRSKTLINYISDKETILKYSKELLYKDILIDSVRLIGISLSNLNLKEKKETFNAQLKLEF